VILANVGDRFICLAYAIHDISVAVLAEEQNIDFVKDELWVPCPPSLSLMRGGRVCEF